MITGGVDGALCPWGLLCMTRSGRLSTATDPDRAYRPFTIDAAGYVPAEGGAILALENAERARERGAQIYGEIAGYGATFDPRPGSRREPGLRRAAELALGESGLTPSDIDVVFADAAAIPALDRIEAQTLIDLFGERGVAVTAPKTMVGRLLAGGSSLDVATALLALRDDVIPPTINVTAPLDAIDLVTEKPRMAKLGAALILARGYGGFNSAMVVSSCPKNP